MDKWLYKEVLKEDNLRAPSFARQSTINWMKALRFEIINEHVRIPDQSCHLFQPNAATHSISKLPPIRVNAATH